MGKGFVNAIEGVSEFSIGKSNVIRVPSDELSVTHQRFEEAIHTLNKNNKKLVYSREEVLAFMGEE